MGVLSCSEVKLFGCIKINLKCRVIFLLMFGASIRAQDSLGLPQSIQPPFDVKEVTKQVLYNRGEALRTTGEFIVDTSIYTSEVHDQSMPSIAFDGTNYLVVWEDTRGYKANAYDVFCARVAPTGTVLDPLGLIVTIAPGDQRYPAVAFDGNNFLVVWEDRRRRPSDSSDIYGARVSRTGAVLDSNGIKISTKVTGQTQNAVAFDGSNYMVVWNYIYGQRVSYYYVYGARISQDGNVLDTGGIQITDNFRVKSMPSVGFDGTNYLVVWQSSGICGARVSRSGTILDSLGFTISSGNNSNPAISFDGNSYLVTWEDRRATYPYSDIYGARVSPSGAVIDSFPISTQFGCQLSPRLAHGLGNQMLITYTGWTDSINTHIANTFRIWGSLYPFSRIEEARILNLKSGILALSVYPNPFRRAAQIKFIAGHSAKSAELKIFDVSGRVVKQFNHLTIQPFNQITWDGSDDSGRRLPAGVYFCRLESGDVNLTKKVVKLR